MSEILNLDIYDHEYLLLIAQGRDPVQEHICQKNLIRAGVPPTEASQVVPLLKKPNLSAEEQALVDRIWKCVRSA